ncbi:hypothetical protein HHI36_007523 [Cryptolaemus montrouzieri]|uniref:Anti-proliferative protein domain-containing protein n=1 Tax=Cryptolaemus montrouzieri TaxID=559131 RepID=A0ABD2MPW1_9CUCU
MHIEVQVALNFVISYLYNKLPRRRVNIFGEELEKALKEKFQGHWYPEKPYKGSAFRCLKTGDPIDKVLERAARESGVPIQDILENLPQELAVWVDPGEVSYRIGEKGAVKVLFSDKTDPQDEHSADREVTKTFNPEAQCFRPIESVSCSLGNMSLSPKNITPYGANGANIHPQNQVGPQLPVSVPVSNAAQSITPAQNNLTLQTLTNSVNHLASSSSAPSPTSGGNSYKGSPSPVPAFIPRSTAPLTFTTATFAQTKFGSTKLKTSSKRANRMSPTEFSNYIKQRAAMQQQVHQPPQQHHSPNGRALSPDTSNYYFPHGPYGPHQFANRSMLESSNQFLSPDLYPGKMPYDPSSSAYYPTNNPAPAVAPPSAPTTPQENGKLLDNSWPYPNAGQYQHLLVAN